MKSIEFPIPSYDQWVEEATKALKGKPFESLFTKTIENITLEPLYTEQQLIEKYGEALEKQVATIREATAQDRFQTAQQIVGETEEAFLSNLEESLARGNEVLVIDSRVPFEWTEDGLTTITDYLAQYPFKLTIQGEEDAIFQAFQKISLKKSEHLEGYILSDKNITISTANVRSIPLNAIELHNNGANAVQELAYVLAKASELAKNEADFTQFERKLFVQFAIDTQFFTEIAKVRAFRILWKAFAAAFNADTVSIPVVAETSVRSFSKLDVYVNLLRSGNEALAAAIAGVDVFTVHPHDILTSSSEQSIRIARNISIITKEESHVLKVTDPAGGSYFVEDLTAQLVKEAWALFIEIEQAGGYTAYEATLNEQVNAVYEERLKQVSTRKHSLIGTNIYANPSDAITQNENPIFAQVKRLAKPFEQLKQHVQQHPIDVEILTFGELKNYKPRADYVAGVLAVAGIEPVMTEGFQQIEDAANYLQQTKASHVILVATDEDTKAIVPALLKAKPDTVKLDAAGKYKEEATTWLNEGLNGFIYAGQNIVEKLQQMLATQGEA